ncbi:hypothetical protein IWZ03DRAFT_238667 [Phyllosticta citriasiana]|uniref:Uncharacterized protein n=1 Tax=Phyllosticta citriasiana TaxID=595635 RepID=A0ABR1KF78_9PEZI
MTSHADAGSRGRTCLSTIIWAARFRALLRRVGGPVVRCRQWMLLRRFVPSSHLQRVTQWLRIPFPSHERIHSLSFASYFMSTEKTSYFAYFGPCCLDGCRAESKSHLARPKHVPCRVKKKERSPLEGLKPLLRTSHHRGEAGHLPDRRARVPGPTRRFVSSHLRLFDLAANTRISPSFNRDWRVCVRFQPPWRAPGTIAQAEACG